MGNEAPPPRDPLDGPPTQDKVSPEWEMAGFFAAILSGIAFLIAVGALIEGQILMTAAMGLVGFFLWQFFKAATKDSYRGYRRGPK